MKRVLCPRCDHYISFNETKYPEAAGSLFFVCHHCGKEFKVSFEQINENNQILRDINESDDEFPYGYIVVIENTFGYKQQLPLSLGDNVVGRYSKGTDVEVPIVSADPSMGRRHCVINVKESAAGKLVFTVRDQPSVTGTFLRNECLRKKERVMITDGAVVTIGATTFILRTPEVEEDDDDFFDLD